jgi:hypothetical protein
MSGEHLGVGTRSHFRRKRLLYALGLAVLLYAAPQAQPASDDKEVESSKKSGEQSKKSPNKSADKSGGENTEVSGGAKAKKSSLTIVVRGGKKPSEQAEVRVTPISQSGEKKTSEIRRFTDSQGQIVFSALDVGTVEVLVIAKGWKTSRQQITLKAGENPLKIELEPL